MENYKWPGNVRELRNVIESAIAMAEDKMIHTRDLPRYLRDVLFDSFNETTLLSTLNEDLDLKHQMEAFEAQVIKEALRRCDGNKTGAAKLLGLHRSLLYKKMNKHGISN